MARGNVRSLARELTAWLAVSGLDPNRIKMGLEPTGCWYSRSDSAWVVLAAKRCRA